MWCAFGTNFIKKAAALPKAAAFFQMRRQAHLILTLNAKHETLKN